MSMTDCTDPKFVEIGLPISSESIEFYKKKAHRYLNSNKATLRVSSAGTDETGRTVYGIKIKFCDGREEWYDSDDDEVLVGWTDIKDAFIVLQDKVLPNLGYALYQQDLLAFHQNMC